MHFIHTRLDEGLDIRQELATGRKGGHLRAMPQGQGYKITASNAAAGVYLLFEPAGRPDAQAVFSAVEQMPLASVTHDPERDGHARTAPAGPADAIPRRWLELMLSGMTFDLLGLSPGPCVRTPVIAHRFGCDPDFDPEAVEAMALVPGPHLLDGANSLPIVRAMLDLACGIARRVPGVRTICWSPARTAVALPMFCKSVEAWLAGGAFPALGLTGIALREDRLLASEGLAYFVGQELVIGAELSRNRIRATKLATRLIHEIVGSGRIERPREYRADDGAMLMLSPVRGGSEIEVSLM